MKKTNNNLQKTSQILTLNLAKKKKRSKIITLLLGFFIGMVNGFLGGGGGMVCVPALKFLCAKEDKHAHATTLFVMLPLCIVSFVVYLLANKLNLNNSLFVIIGFVAGGFLGALLLKKLKNFWLEIIFCGVTLFCGIRLLF